MKKSILFLSLLFTAVTGYGHVGSPGVTFEGDAGPYKLLVNITPPDVIPGTALVTIYLEGGDQNISISARPIYWLSGADGSPKADIAVPSATEPGRYELKLWLMTTGTSSVQLMVNGARGKGIAVIPVMAVSTARRNMPPGLGWALLAMAVFLLILMITIVGSSVSDSLLNPGERFTKKLRRRQISGAVTALVILVLILWGGRSWWNAAADEYTRYLYRPLQATTTLDASNGTLKLVIDTASLKKTGNANRMYLTRKMNYIVPDHGKLMHLFLVRSGELNAFAHLHPRRLDSLTFVAAMPDLPAGRYWVYADITRLSGFAETIVDTLDIPENKLFHLVSNRPDEKIPVNKDDTYFVTNPLNGGNMPASTRPSVLCGSAGIEARLPDGSSAVWLQTAGQTIRSGELTMLRFEILDKNRKPAKLEPYLGMAAHAVILKDDGSVYIHLHPAGSFSMGSQKALLDRIAFHQPLNEYLPKPSVFADSVDHLVNRLDTMDEKDRNEILMAGMEHPMETTGAHHMQEVSFPYTFPQPGKYRIFIQAKRGGQILNTAFDADIL